MVNKHSVTDIKMFNKTDFSVLQNVKSQVNI